MCDNEEARICDNCEFSQFGDEYKEGAFEGMCQNHNIVPGGSIQSFLIFDVPAHVVSGNQNRKTNAVKNIAELAE